MTNYFRKPDALVDAVRAVLSGQSTETQTAVEAKLDPVDQKALKGKHKDRKDKDIDNDGDVDSTDQYLHKRRKAVSKAIANEAKDDEDEVVDKDDDEDEDEKKAKKNKPSDKKDEIDVKPTAPEQSMVAEKEMTAAQKKKREEIVLSMKDKMGDFKKKYGDRARDVMYATATKMAMKEGFELDIEKSSLIEEVELDEAKYDLYHKDFSSAMQHAYKMAKKLHGITIDPKEIDDKVATGPKKPGSGKTNSYRLKGDKGAIQVQVYNKGGSKPFELNMYKEEVDEKKLSPQERDALQKKYGSKAGKKRSSKAYQGKFKEEVGLDEAFKKGDKVTINVAKSSEPEMQRLRKELGDTISGIVMGQSGRILMVKTAKGQVNPHVKDVMKEEVGLDEGRGRPRKDGKSSSSDDREHIQMQLRKSVSLRGLKDVEFDDGKKVKVPAKVAQSVMSKIDGIKDAKQKQNAVQHISKSHKHMMDFHKGDYKDKEQRRQDAINAPFKKK